MGFAGGHSGRLLADLAQKEGFSSSWTWTNAETRNCTILIAQNGDATVINEPGVSISTADWKQLSQDVQKQLPMVNRACLSGSLPPNSTAEDLRGLLRILVDSGKQIWVDTSGMALKVALDYPELCIKVNGNEIGDMLGLELNDLASAERALVLLREHGLTTSVITLGPVGALLATQEGKWHAQGPKVNVVSTVGSGDAFLGGFVSALDAGKDWPKALCDAVAAGTANTLSPGGGQFGIETFYEIHEQISVQAI